MRRSRLIASNQQGMVSIIVTMILMIVITLIVIGFATISRREQRQALDRHLSTQAFYAAESGVNDAIKAMQAGHLTSNKNDCGPDASVPELSDNVVDSTNGVSYTCLLVNQQGSPEISYDATTVKAISADMKFVNSGGSSVTADKITITWTKNPGSGIASTAYPALQTLAGWGADGMPMLRTAVTNLSGADPYRRSSLNNNTFTTYLYPSDGDATERTVAFASTGTNIDDQGEIVKADCSGTPTTCTAEITLSDLSHVFLRISTIYANADVKISASSDGSTVLIDGAQAIIDSTGKAQDVLRRIQVRVPISPPQSDVPVFAVQAVEGICKQLGLSSSSSSNVDGCPLP